MTCKDCLHCEVCGYLLEKETYNVEPDGWDGEICKYFKNKNTHADVPCTIGQSVWKLYAWYNGPSEIIESRVSMLQQKADRSWKIRISNIYGTDDFKASDLGDYVFLSKDEAEAALAALNKNSLN